MISKLTHLVHLAQSTIHEAAKNGSKLAQLITGEPPRSPHWPTIEKRWRAAHPTCAACGGMDHLQVHHKIPFKHDPTLELQDGTGRFPATGGVGAKSNLITLCEGMKEHHLLGGHGGDFKFANLNVENDAKEMLEHPEREQQILARARAGRTKS